MLIQQSYPITPDLAAPRARTAALLICMPLSIITLSECLYRMLHQQWLINTAAGPMGLVYGPYVLLVPTAAGMAAVALARGPEHRLAVIVGYALALFAMHYFRGSHHWPGLFDLSSWSKLQTYLPIGGSLLLGLCLAPALRRWSPSVVYERSITVLIVLACVWSIRDAFYLELFSAFPYTRHFAMVGLGITSAIGFIYLRFVE
jgi:hypothetical protein